MDCTEFLARYSDYDDSLIGGAELERFRTHLAGCEACARYDRVLRKGRMLARQMPPPPPRDDFVPELEYRLMAGTRARVGRGAALPAVVAGMAAIVVATGLWVAGAGPLGPPVTRLAAEPAGHEHPEAAAYEAVAPAPASGSRVVTLPPSAHAEPGDWTARGVDRRVASSYSPLITGPPAYRGAPASSTGSTFSTRTTLD